MAEIEITGGLGSALMRILEAEEIQPGTDIGYELCKLLWQFHPLGGKLVEKPILMAMCKPRQYNVETDPDERVVRRFQEVPGLLCEHGSATVCRVFCIAGNFKGRWSREPHL